MKKILLYLNKKWMVAVLGFAIGALTIIGIRLALYAPEEEVHYHANFTVYIKGQREQFKPMFYYEEETATSCSAEANAEEEDGPMSRVHMHGNINDVVHVEDDRVTWGNFFSSIGWNISSNYLASRDAVYQNGNLGKVTYILNGKKIGDVSNLTIGDQDKLLVNYGNQDSLSLSKEYGKIQNKALEANQSKDPAGCGGGSHNGATILDRLRHVFN